MKQTDVFLLLLPIMAVLILSAGYALGGAKHHPHAWTGLAALLVLVAWLTAAGLSAARGPGPPAVGRIVRVAVTGVILLDAAFLLTAGQIVPGVLCAVVLLPTLAMIRYLPQRREPVTAP